MAEMNGEQFRRWAASYRPGPSLADLAGPSETMEAAGLTNRGSLTYAMTHRGFPAPVKVLRGIRLWDLAAVREWTERNRKVEL